MDRRSFLVAVGITMTGCGGSNAGSTASDTPTSTGDRLLTTSSPRTPIDYSTLFRDRLATRNINVDYLAKEGIRAKLDYYVDDVTPAVIEESLHFVAQAFVAPITRGWSVEGLDATVYDVANDDSVGTYRIEAIWTKQYQEKTIDRDTYIRKVLETLNIDPEVVSTPSPSPTPSPGDGSSDPAFDLSAVDAEPSDSGVSISIDFNHKTTRTVDLDPDDETSQTAPSSNTFLAVQVRIKNLGDTTFWFYPGAIDLRQRDGDIVEYAKFNGSPNPLHGASIAPDGELVGGIPYQIFHTVTEGELIFDQSPYSMSVSCTFNRDENLTVTI